MGSAPSKQDAGFSGLESEALREAFPRGLEDERCKQLKYELSWCLQANDWYFTGGGLVIGSLLSYFTRSTKPIGVAAVVSPAADWAYGRHVCKGCEEEYNAHRRSLMETYRTQAEEIRKSLRGAE